MNPDSTPLEWIGKEAVSLDNCQGDCDNDDDCNGDLICWQRGNAGTNPIPGCTGDLLAIDTANNDPGIDYCYDPNPTTPSPTGRKDNKHFSVNYLLKQDIV